MLIRAPAKLNLCLYLGGRRPDGLHELCSLFEPIGLHDLIDVTPAERDEVSSAGLDGEDLAKRALGALREGGWSGDPVQVRIDKRIPIAAGLGGGSADAAAVLRLARGEVGDLARIALELGADVPSQLDPAFALVGGAGEVVERLPDPETHGLVLLPDPAGLSTAEVFAEADRLGLGRDRHELEGLRSRLREAAAGGTSPLVYSGLLHNDLEGAALSLRPSIGDALTALKEAGAAAALVTGSGPTAFGLFAGLDEARQAAAAIGRDDAIVCEGGWAG